MEKVDHGLLHLLEERAQRLAEATRRGDSAAAAEAADGIDAIVHYEGRFEDLPETGGALHPYAAGVGRGFLSPSAIRRLAAHPAVLHVRRPPTAYPALDKSVPAIQANTAWVIAAASGDPATAKGAGVLVGIVDSGIDVFHGAFRKPDGTTRIKFLWDQTFRFNAAGVAVDGNGKPLTGSELPKDEAGNPLTQARTPFMLHSGWSSAYDFGAEFSATEINAALAAHPDGKDMPVSLRDFPTPDGTYHGTHVAGIAAGNGGMNDKCTAPGTYVGVAPEADLVIVKSGVGRPDALFNETLAIRYCFDIANLLSGAIGPKKPCVVNLSLGGHFGPHNGQDADSRNIDALTAGPLDIGRAVVFAAGNDRGINLHAAFTIAPGGTQVLRVNLQSTSSKSLGVFFSKDSASSVNCLVRLPSNGGAPRQGSAKSTASSNAAETVSGYQLEVSNLPQATSDPDRHFYATATPVSNAPPGGTSTAVVETGIWEFELSVPAASPAANIHAWVYRPQNYSAAILPFPGGAASPQDQDRAASARRPEDWIRATLKRDATCQSAITVAAYNAEESGTPLAAFSAQGPAPNDLVHGLYDAAHALAKPDIAAPGVAIDAPRAMRRKCCLECDCCVSNYVAEQGTSMAAPHITGVVALMMAQNPALTGTEIKAMLKAAAMPPPAAPPGWPPLPELWGAGKVDAAQAVTAAVNAARQALPEEARAVTPVPELLAAAAVARPLGWPERLEEWTRSFGQRPAWNFFAALVGEHFDEVKRLIDTNRRVGAVWQRHGGPSLVRSLVFAPAPRDPPVPAALAAEAPRELFRRLAQVLLRYGGPGLRADILRHGALLDALPGASWDELDRLAAAGAA